MALTAYPATVPGPPTQPTICTQRGVSRFPLSVALLGFGTVGRAVAEILCRAPGPELRLSCIFNRNLERKRAHSVPDAVQWTENFADVVAGNADIVVELIGGLDPALRFIRRALLSGKSVVTANKHVIAKHGMELFALARQVGQRLEYGASVGGGVPILAALQHGLSGDRLFRACGILNGTCNYILSSMEANGTTLAAALAQAKKLGYAESDPSDDVSGLDAACKLAIAARAGFRADLNAFDVPRRTIKGIKPADFGYARQLGCTIRQISFAELNETILQSAVGPALVPLNSPLAKTVDNQNAIVFTGEKSGDTLLAGRGAGGDPTAVAVVSDLLAIAHSGQSPGLPSVLSKFRSGELKREHYLRVETKKQTNVVDSLSRRLADYGVEISRVLEPSDEKKLQWAFALKQCGSLVLEEAIDQITKLDGISENMLALPIFA